MDTRAPLLRTNVTSCCRCREGEWKKKRVKKTYADDGGGDRCVRYNVRGTVYNLRVYGIIVRGRHGGDARGAPVAADNREIAAVE